MSSIITQIQSGGDCNSSIHSKKSDVNAIINQLKTTIVILSALGKKDDSSENLSKVIIPNLKNEF